MRLIEEMGLEDGSYPTYVSGFYRDTFVTIMYDSDPYCPLGEWDQTATAVGTWGRWKSQNFGNNHELDGAKETRRGWRTDEMIDYMSLRSHDPEGNIGNDRPSGSRIHALLHWRKIDDWFGDRRLLYRSILGDRSSSGHGPRAKSSRHIVTGKTSTNRVGGIIATRLLPHGSEERRRPVLRQDRRGSSRSRGE